MWGLLGPLLTMRDTEGGGGWWGRKGRGSIKGADSEMLI